MENQLIVEDELDSAKNEINPNNYQSAQVNYDKSINSYNEFSEAILELNKIANISSTKCLIDPETSSINSVYACIEQLSELIIKNWNNNHAQIQKLGAKAIEWFNNAYDKRIEKLLNSKSLIYPLPKPINANVNFFERNSLTLDADYPPDYFSKDVLTHLLSNFSTKDKQKIEKKLDKVKQNFIKEWLEARKLNPVIRKLLDAFLVSSDSHIFVYANAHGLINPQNNQFMGGLFGYQSNNLIVPYKSIEPLQGLIVHEGIHGGLRNLFQATNGEKMLSQYYLEYWGVPYKVGNSSANTLFKKAISHGINKVEEFKNAFAKDEEKIINTDVLTLSKYSKFSEAIEKFEFIHFIDLTPEQANIAKAKNLIAGKKINRKIFDELKINRNEILNTELIFESLTPKPGPYNQFYLVLTFKMENLSLEDKVKFFLEHHSILSGNPRSGVYDKKQYVAEYFGYLYSRLPLELIEYFYEDLNNYFIAALNLNHTVTLHHLSNNKVETIEHPNKDEAKENQAEFSQRRQLLSLEDETVLEIKSHAQSADKNNNLIKQEVDKNTIFSASQNKSTFFNNMTSGALLTSALTNSTALLSQESTITAQNQQTSGMDLVVNPWLLIALASGSLIIFASLLFYINEQCKKIDNNQYHNQQPQLR